MKVIDLLNKIANGEETPKKIRIDHWCYTFEWVEHDSNYYDKHEDIDLMSCLSMDKEELNYGVHELKEDKEIEEEKPIKEVKEIRELIEASFSKLEEAQDKINRLENELEKRGNKDE